MLTLKSIGEKYNIPMVKIWNGSFQGITEFMEAVGGEEQCEGYIIRFANGHMVKLKNAWYLNLHRAKSQLENEKNVYRLVLSESHDDLLPQLDLDARRALEDFAAALAQQVKLVASRYEAGVHHARQAWPLRKDFAINFATKQDLPVVIFKILDGKPAYDAVVDWLTDQTSTQAKLDAAKRKFGQINWRDYYYPVDMDA